MNLEMLNKIFEGLEDGKKETIKTMFNDFLFEINELEQIKTAIEKIGVPKSKQQAEKKRYYIRIYSDISQRHDSKIKIMLSVLNKADSNEDDELLKLLSQI